MEGHAVSPSRDMRWRARAVDLELDQVERLHKHAEQWRNGLTGLTGLTALFAVVAIAKGRASFSDLTDTGRIWAIALLALAFVLLVAGSLLAMRASFGHPKEIDLSVEALQEWDARESDSVQHYLLAAKIVFLAGVVSIAAATGITWINARASPPAFVYVRLTEMSVVCGALKAGTGSALVVEPSDKKLEAREIPVGQVQTLEVVASCPKPG